MKKANQKIMIYSLIGLIFIVLTYAVNWIFIVGAVAAVWLNQRELMNNKNRIKSI